MLKKFSISDLNFLKAVEKAAIEPAEFDHISHLRLAWLHISLYGIEQSLSKVPELLLRLVEKFNELEKYNHSLTIAGIKIVYDAMLNSKSANFNSFLKNNPILVNNFNGLIYQHYNKETIQSQEAKLGWVEPDILEFNN